MHCSMEKYLKTWLKVHSSVPNTQLPFQHPNRNEESRSVWLSSPASCFSSHLSMYCRVSLQNNNLLNAEMLFL